jgi:hypothetical protein
MLAALVLAAAAAWCGGRGIRRAIGIGPAGLHLRCTSACPPEAEEAVSVLIPLRHRPDAAIAAVRAALGQRGVDHLDIVVLDDGCPQETRTALRQEFGDDPRVRILAAAPLPRGWSPLAHRSHQLAVAARGKVLIFAEPCAPLGPNAAASAAALLRTEQLDLALLDTGRPAQAQISDATEGEGGEQAVESRRGDSQAAASDQSQSQSRARSHTRPRVRAHGSARARVHPGRFAVAIDADAYWRIGGYRAAAGDPDPLALLRTVRRASGRAAVADGRRVIPPAQVLDPLPSFDPQTGARARAGAGVRGVGIGLGADGEVAHGSRASLSETARRVIAALVGVRP